MAVDLGEAITLRPVLVKPISFLVVGQINLGDDVRPGIVES